MNAPQVALFMMTTGLAASSDRAAMACAIVPTAGAAVTFAAAGADAEEVCGSPAMMPTRVSAAFLAMWYTSSS